MAPIGNASEPILGTKRLIEKLQRKEREEVSKLLKEMDSARRKKALIESQIPFKRRQYVAELEAKVQAKQNAAKQEYERKQQEMLDKQERER